MLTQQGSACCPACLVARVWDAAVEHRPDLLEQLGDPADDVLALDLGVAKIVSDGKLSVWVGALLVFAMSREAVLTFLPGSWISATEAMDDFLSGRISRLDTSRRAMH